MTDQPEDLRRPNRASREYVSELVTEHVVGRGLAPDTAQLLVDVLIANGVLAEEDANVGLPGEPAALLAFPEDAGKLLYKTICDFAATEAREWVNGLIRGTSASGSAPCRSPSASVRLARLKTEHARACWCKTRLVESIGGHHAGERLVDCYLSRLKQDIQELEKDAPAATTPHLGLFDELRGWKAILAALKRPYSRTLHEQVKESNEQTQGPITYVGRRPVVSRKALLKWKEDVESRGEEISRSKENLAANIDELGERDGLRAGDHKMNIKRRRGPRGRASGA